MQVEKWGDDLAVRLPADVVAALGLKADDEIEVQVTRGGAFHATERANVAESLARLRCYRGSLPDDFRFDRLTAQERG